MKKPLILSLLIVPWLIVQGQKLTPEVVVSSGEFFQGSSGSLSFSLGECVTETYSNSQGSVAQGFQQGTLTIGTLLKNEKFDISISVYPVPTAGIVNLKVQDYNDVLTAVILDLAGHEIIKKALTQTISEFDLTKFTSGNYIMNVTNKSGILIQSFKITKH